MILKKIKMIVFVVCSVLVIGVAGLFLFTTCAPQFGGAFTKADLKKFEELPNFKNRTFQNQELTVMDMNFAKGISVMKEFSKNKEIRTPQTPLPQEKPNVSLQNSSEFTITWCGHSTLLLQGHGKTILLDPMLGKVASPVSFMGTKRFSELPVTAEQLPHIDVVVISHDHYDHLDYKTILAIKDKTSLFIMPLGVARHLLRWGVEPSKIVELNWGEKYMYQQLEFTCAPTRHFTGRGVKDRNTTLWASWIIASNTQKVFFSGDGGYGKHFKTIGEQYGPFDIAFIECGQYNERWHAIHMYPEESVQAAIDLKTKIAMPIHWGAFSLAPHSWFEPIERFTTEAQKLQVNYVIPKIGQTFTIDELPDSKWWKMQ